MAAPDKGEFMSAQPNPPASSKRLHINPPVFFISAVLIIGLAVTGVLFPEFLAGLFTRIQQAIVDSLGWFYMISVAVFLVFVIALAASPHGRVRLGPDDSRPDYSYTSWFQEQLIGDLLSQYEKHTHFLHVAANR